jgi:hypothetical protein
MDNEKVGRSVDTETAEGRTRWGCVTAGLERGGGKRNEVNQIRREREREKRV